MKYKNIIFDLDGTISDSSPGIINAYLYSLNKIGLMESSNDIIRSYIGHPLRAYYTERHNLSANDSELAVKFFREHYNDIGIYENNIYPGMADLLSALKVNRKELYIATSKPEKFALKVLSHFNIIGHFSLVKGSDMSPDNKPKHEIIRIVMENGKLDPKECVMIGDRYHDIRGAKENGISSIAVTYGFGSREELAKESPDHFADSAGEIRKLLI